MKNIYRILVILILLLEVNFFSIIELPDSIKVLNSYHVKKLIFIICLLTTILWILVEKVKKIKIIRRFSLSVVFFLISLILITVLSSIAYNESIAEILKVTYYYYIIMIYYYFTFFCIIDESNYRFLINSIIIIGLIFSILLSIQYVFFRVGLSEFLIFNDYNLVVLNRNFNPRIARPADFISISCILSFSKVFNKHSNIKRKIMYLLSTFIQMFYIVVIAQTRMYIVALVVTMILAILFVNKRLTLRRIVIINCICMFISIIGFASFKEFFSTFITGERITSTIIRIQELQFYLNQIFKNIIFGRGFVNPATIEGYRLSYGPNGNYNVADIGVLGFWAIFGVFGIIFIIMITRNIIRIFRNYKMIKHSEYKIQLILLSIFLSISSLTLFYMDIQRIVLLPIILTIFEVINYRSYIERC